MSEISSDVETILSNRYRPPRHLESAFLSALDEYGVSALNLAQFIKLVEKLMDEARNEEKVEAQKRGLVSNVSDMSDEELNSRRKNIADAFIDCDLDGRCVCVYANQFSYVCFFDAAL
jgi:hypothetical protein